jgi:hypothetical protein
MYHFFLSPASGKHMRLFYPDDVLIAGFYGAVLSMDLNLPLKLRATAPELESPQLYSIFEYNRRST